MFNTQSAKVDNGKLIDLIRQKDAEIATLNKTLKIKDASIKCYQERLLTVPILEHKLTGLKENHEKEKEQVRNYYQKEFMNLIKEVRHIHQVLSMNLSLDDKIKLLEKEIHTYKEFNIKKIETLQILLQNMDGLNQKVINEQLHNGTTVEDPYYSRQASIVRPTINLEENHKPQTHRPSTTTAKR